MNRPSVWLGTKEFRVGSCGRLALLAVVAVLAHASDAPFSGDHLTVTVPVTIGLGLLGRYLLRLCGLPGNCAGADA